MDAARSERRFSLLEVIVAMLILSIGMLGVGTMITTSFNNDRYNQRVRNADYLATGKVEELRALSAAKLNMGSELSETDSGSDDPSGNSFVRQWTVYTEESDADNVRRVMVIVGWPKNDRCTKDQPGLCTFKVRRYGFIITE